MKKLFHPLIILLALVVLISATATNAFAATQVFYPAELEYVDAQINVMLPRLDKFQAEYFEINKRYYQALTSTTTVPNVPVVPDQIEVSPTDQVETLAFFWDASSLPDTLAWSFRIDTYSGPDGDGYVLTIATTVKNETWMRVINYGPDTYRAVDWYLVVPFEF